MYTTTSKASPLRSFVLTLALVFIGAGAAPVAYAQVSVDRPDEVRHLKEARETVADANETAAKMAEEMKKSKKKFNRLLDKLSGMKEGTRAYNLAFERARAAHSEMMRIRKGMLDKLMAAYGSADGSLNKALKSREKGAGLAEEFEKKVEQTEKEIEEARAEGKKVDVIESYGGGDDEYQSVLRKELRTIKHEIGVKEDYIQKTKAQAEKTRQRSRDALYDRLRGIKAVLDRRRAEFRYEKKHLQNTAQRLRQGLEMRQNLAAFRQFYDEMKQMSKTLKGLDEEIKAIYTGFPEAPSLEATLPDPGSLDKDAGSPVMGGTTDEESPDFIQEEPSGGGGNRK
jgi:DNA repair exonuclease SbcCD ATPase subunit